MDICVLCLAILPSLIPTLYVSGDGFDFSCVSNRPVLPSSDNMYIGGYRGTGYADINVLFRRTVNTGGIDGLPRGHNEKDHPDKDARRLYLPKKGGQDRIGVYYCEASLNEVTKNVPIIISSSDAVLKPTSVTLTVSNGEDVTLEALYFGSGGQLRWIKDGNTENILSTSLRLTITNANLNDQGIYECYRKGDRNNQRHAIMRLIVRECQADKYNPPQCNSDCPKCYNGGICDDKLGHCICAPGFSGTTCEILHGKKHFGQDGVYTCPSNYNLGCKGYLFCLPDPYGCSCVAGYKGLACNTACARGTFGADCKLTCHCEYGNHVCEPDTGLCSSGTCVTGWTGPNCQEPGQVTSLDVQPIPSQAGSLLVDWLAPITACTRSYIVLYQLNILDQCDNQGGPSTRFWEGTDTSVNITSLQPYSTYTLSVLATSTVGSTENNEQETTGIIGPTAAPENVQHASRTNTSLEFNWNRVTCGQRGGLNSFKYELHDEKEHLVSSGTTSELFTTITELKSCAAYRFKVRAFNAAGHGDYSQAVDGITNIDGAPTTNVRTFMVTSTSLALVWNIPDCSHRNGIIIGYIYRFGETIETTLEHATTSTNVTFTELKPFTEYVLQVAAETEHGKGPITSLYCMTAEDVPSEPGMVSSQIININSITITWLAPIPANGIILSYDIRYSWMTTDLQNTVTIPGVLKNTVHNNTLAHKLDNLKENQTYSIQIRGETSAGKGSWSNPLTVTTRVSFGMHSRLDFTTPTTVGIFIGAIAVILIFVAIGVLYFKRRVNKKRGESKPDAATVSIWLQDRSKKTSSPGHLFYDNDQTRGATCEEDVYSSLWFIPWNNIRLLGEQLGRGNFGEVQKGKVMVDGKWIVSAIKTLRAETPESEKAEFKKEFNTMNNIKQHPNVVAALGYSEFNGTLYVALEYVTQGDLRSFLRKSRRFQREDKTADDDVVTSLSPHQLLKFALDAANGMVHLSLSGVIHRDLAARNILVGEENGLLIAKVSDFGMSREMDEYVQTSKKRVPTRWLAPESLNHNTYTTKSDMWSFGILLWEIVTLGGTPYSGIASKDLTSKLNSGYRMPKPSNCDQDTYALMLNCWQEYPEDRSTFKCLAQTFQRMLSRKKICVTTTIYENFKHVPISPGRDDM